MKQITEDYCSFEIAKLLKEKGFDEICNYEWWIPDTDKGYVFIANGQIKNSNLIDEAYTAPSQSLALKWLREVHNWYIDIRFNRHYQYYIPIVYNMSGTLESIANLEERPKQYEQAVEAALLYVLKNLI
jgi:hypothetical protein